MTGIFLQLSRVLPGEYPLRGNVQSYLSAEHGFGRLVDFGMIAPRLQQLYQWSAHELAAPGLLDCVRDGAMTYAWPFEDRDVWQPPKSFILQMAQRAIPTRTTCPDAGPLAAITPVTRRLSRSLADSPLRRAGRTAAWTAQPSGTRRRPASAPGSGLGRPRPAHAGPHRTVGRSKMAGSGRDRDRRCPAADPDRHPRGVGRGRDRRHRALATGETACVLPCMSDVGGPAVRGDHDQSGSPADRDGRARGVRGGVDRCHCAPRPFDTYTVCVEGDSGRACPRHAVAALDGISRARVDWSDSKGLNQWERTALELAEERSQLG